MMHPNEGSTIQNSSQGLNNKPENAASSGVHSSRFEILNSLLKDSSKPKLQDEL